MTSCMTSTPQSRALGHRTLTAPWLDTKTPLSLWRQLGNAGLMGSDPPTPPPPTSPSIPQRPGASGGAVEILIPSPAWHDRRAKVASAALIVVGGVVAALTALEVLYFPDYAWGDWRDIVVAVVWGLGVYAVANATYRSVPTVIEKIGVGSP